MTYATLAFVVALAGAAAAADLPAYTPDASAPCDQIPAVYHWNLAPLFASDAAWDAARTQLLADVPKLADLLGQARRPAAARGVPRSLFQLHNRANALTLYPNMRQAVAQTDDAAAAMVQSTWRR